LSSRHFFVIFLPEICGGYFMPETDQKKGSKTKKINRLTLAEIEAQLESIKKAEGSLSSKHAQQLLARKAVLTRKI